MLRSAAICLIFWSCMATAATAQSPRAQFYEQLGDFLEWVYQNARPDRVDSFTDSRFAGIKDDVSKLQKWSGSKGVALQIRLARNRANPSFKVLVGDAGINVIGPGNDIVHATVQSLDFPTVSAGPPDGYEFSPDDSYYVWATEEAGSVKFQPFPAEYTVQFNQNIRSARAVFIANTAVARAEKIETYRNLLRRCATEASNAQERQAIQDLNTDFEALTSRLETNETNLQRALDRANKLAAAYAPVDQLSAVLSFAVVLGNATSSVDAADRRELENAKNIDELKNLIRETHRQRMQGLRNIEAQMSGQREEMRRQNDLFRSYLQRYGAPWQYERITPPQYGQDAPLEARQLP
jgi:hypothetical protein